jgi:hypothetical protein
VGFEAIAVWESAVGLPWLPFRPGVLEEGGGDVFWIGVSATHRSEQVETEGKA